MYEDSALTAVCLALLNHIALSECVYLISRSENTCCLQPSAFSGVFLVNSLRCCVARLLLWPVCMLQTGRGRRHKVLLSCGGITNDGGTLCGFLVCLLPCYVACFW